MKIDRVQLRILKCLQLRLLSTFTWYNCLLCILAGLTFSYLLDHFYSLHGGKKLCRGHFLTSSFSSYPWTAIKPLDVSEVRSRTLNDKDCGAVFRIFNRLAVEGSDKEVRTDKIFSDKISPDILCQWWHPGTHTLPVLQAGLIIITISCLLSAIIQSIKEVIQSRMSIFQILHLACSSASLWYNCGITYLERKTNDLIISFLPQIFMVNICGELVRHNVMHHFSCRQATPPSHISTHFHTELLLYEKFLLTNSHSSNSSSSSLCLSVCHLVHYLNYLKLSLSYFCSFGTFSTLVLLL